MLYSASTEDLETIDCFLDFHETNESPKNTQNPVVDLLVSTQDAQDDVVCNRYKLKKLQDDVVCNRYKLSCNSPTPIILQQVRSYMKHKFERKTRQHDRVLVNLLTNIKLKVKEGTHSTFQESKLK